MKNKLIILLATTGVLLFSACKPDPIVNGPTPSGIDGGVLVSTFAGINIADIKFIDKKTGFVIGSDSMANRLYVTNDSMKTWQDHTLPNYTYFSAFKVLNKGYIYALLTSKSNNETFFCSSTDLGKNWQQYDLSKSESGIENILIGDVLMLNEQEGFLIGYEQPTFQNDSLGLIFKTINGGVSWNRVYAYKISSGYHPIYLNDIIQTSASSILVAGRILIDFNKYKNILIESVDNGITWQEKRLNIPDFLKPENIQTDGTIYALGYSSENYNLSYILKKSPGNQLFDTLKIADSGTVFMNIDVLNNNTAIYCKSSIAYISTTDFKTETPILVPNAGLSGIVNTSWLFTEKDFIIGTSNGNLYRYKLK